MFCTNCGTEIKEDALFCTNCGAKIAEEKEEVKEEIVEETPVEEIKEDPKTEAKEEPKAEAPQTTVIVNNVSEGFVEGKGFIKTASALQLPTERKWWKNFLLGLITFGIYPLVIQIKMTEEINIAASKYDGQRTMHYAFVTMLAPITLGIYPIVWWHGFCNRLGREVKRRGYDYKFSATYFWILAVLLSWTIICPIIYTHKLLKCSNLINKSFNYYG